MVVHPLILHVLFVFMNHASVLHFTQEFFWRQRRSSWRGRIVRREILFLIVLFLWNVFQIGVVIYFLFIFLLAKRNVVGFVVCHSHFCGFNAKKKMWLDDSIQRCVLLGWIAKEDFSSPRDDVD